MTTETESREKDPYRIDTITTFNQLTTYLAQKLVVDKERFSEGAPYRPGMVVVCMQNASVEEVNRANEEAQNPYLPVGVCVTVVSAGGLL